MLGCLHDRATLPSARHVLRLFAVGYEEPCWNTDWAEPPESDSHALDPYRAWALTGWGIEWPPTGIDAFADWLVESGTTG